MQQLKSNSHLIQKYSTTSDIQQLVIKTSQNMEQHKKLEGNYATRFPSSIVFVQFWFNKLGFEKLKVNVNKNMNMNVNMNLCHQVKD